MYMSIIVAFVACGAHCLVCDVSDPAAVVCGTCEAGFTLDNDHCKRKSNNTPIRVRQIDRVAIHIFIVRLEKIMLMVLIQTLNIF